MRAGAWIEFRRVSLTIETDGASYEQPRCPYCHSLDISFEAINHKVGLASLILAFPIPWPKNRWTCRACGQKWKAEPETSA